MIEAVANDITALAELIAGVDKGGARPRVSIDVLVEASGKVASEDLPILSMLVHGTSPADIAGVLGISEHELAGRRARMAALLGDSAR